jgi:hypothetical protein
MLINDKLFEKLLTYQESGIETLATGLAAEVPSKALLYVIPLPLWATAFLV